jgi:hypothetical protein
VVVEGTVVVVVEGSVVVVVDVLRKRASSVSSCSSSARGVLATPDCTNASKSGSVVVVELTSGAATIGGGAG